MNNEEMSDVFNKFMNNMNSSGNVDSSSISNLMNMLKNSNKDGSSNISPEAISNLMQMFQNNANNSNEETDSSNAENASPQIDMDMLMKMKTILEQSNKKNDPRSNLLLSLKPYLKESRQSKVEQYVQLFNMSKMFEIFNKASGGDNTK